MEEKKSRQVVKTASEKVASTVATFLKESLIRSPFKRGISYNYQQIVSEFVKVLSIQEPSEKVASAVATFCQNTAMAYGLLE